MSIVRHRGKENVLTLADHEFMQMMMDRPGSKQWDEILYIQNYIVTPKSVAETLIFKFTAPANLNNPSGPIMYSLRDFESDEFLKINNIYRYAHKICMIIGYYLSKINGLVID